MTISFSRIVELALGIALGLVVHDLVQRFVH